MKPPWPYPKHYQQTLDALALVPSTLGIHFDDEAIKLLRGAGSNFFRYQLVDNAASLTSDARRALKKLAQAAENFAQAIEKLPEDLRALITPPWWSEGLDMESVTKELQERWLSKEDDTEASAKLTAQIDFLDNKIKILRLEALAVGARAHDVVGGLKGSGHGRPRADAEIKLITLLAEIYTRATGRKGTVNRNPINGSYSGDFFSLAQGCLETLGVTHQSSLAWGNAIERGCGLRKRPARPRSFTGEKALS